MHRPLALFSATEAIRGDCDATVFTSRLMAVVKLGLRPPNATHATQSGCVLFDAFYRLHVLYCRIPAATLCDTDVRSTDAAGDAASITQGWKRCLLSRCARCVRYVVCVRSSLHCVSSFAASWLLRCQCRKLYDGRDSKPVAATTNGAGSGMAGMAAAIPIQNLVWRRHTNQK